MGRRGRGIFLDCAPAAVPAAGSDETDATPLRFALSVISDADGDKGVILPVPKVAGRIMVVYSPDATHATKVYPHAGATINQGSADAAVSVAARKPGIFVSTGLMNWSYFVNA